MDPTAAIPIQARSETEGGISYINENSPSIEHPTRSGDTTDHHLIGPTAVLKDATTRQDNVAQLARPPADAPNDGAAEPRKNEQTKIPQAIIPAQPEISALCEVIARLEKAITKLKPARVETDPTANFWTVYKKVADEHDNELVSKYVGDLDNSLLFAGLFSAVTSSFLAQIIQQLQPAPADLTNVLLLRILQQNTSFGGADPLMPISNISTSVVQAQSILFASLSITLFVAFIAVLGKQWILYYTQTSSWGNIVDRGKERQVKLAGLQKWGLRFVMESLPVMLQFALLLFGVALAVFLWDINVSVAEVALAVTSIGFAFYVCIAVIATKFSDCPFQTPLSVLLPKVWPRAKEFSALARIWLRRRAARFRTRLKSLLLPVEWAMDHGLPRGAVRLVFKISTDGADTPNQAGEDIHNVEYMKLSNPAFWRDEPIFTSPVPKDISSSAGFWLLENSTDFLAASAVAAVFSEFQWPSHNRSTTALVRLRDTYEECFRAPEFKKHTSLKALQSAAAYYVLYHTQLIWSASNSLEGEVAKLPPDLPPDLFLHLPRDEWKGDDVFEYLLHVKPADRSEPVKSARFLSYIAPYWFCGNSDTAIKFRPSRLPIMYELIEVLEDSRALNPVTITDCVLCVGAAMDFPLHPDDLIRVDKSDYLVQIFRMAIEHVHSMVLTRGRRRRHTKTALEILLTLAKKITLPLVDAAWINNLLKSATGGNMDDDTLTLFLRFSAIRKEEDATTDGETQPGQETRSREIDARSPGGTILPEVASPGYTLFTKILRNVQICGGRADGWEDEAVYGGLIAVRDIPQLGSYLPDDHLLGTLYDAMGKGEEVAEIGELGEVKRTTRPFRVRKAAYDIILVARDRWLRSTELRDTLHDRDFPRRLHSVVIEAGRSDHRKSFLVMMEILSEDRYWHRYLREAVDIWLSFRHEGPSQVLAILSSVGGLPLMVYEGPNPPLDRFLEKLVEDEWARVPGRLPMDLTPDCLEPLAEVTKRFKELLFTENERRAVLSVVEQVIPSLKERRDDGYEGPGEDVRRIIGDLLEALRMPRRSTSRASTYW